MRLIRAIRGPRRGNATMEFALMLPILLLLSLPVIDYSFYIVAWEAVIDATQVGTRAAAKVPLADGPQGVATAVTTAALAASLPGGMAAPNVNSVVLGGDTIQVTVTVDYTPLVGYIQMPATLSYQHRMRLENP